MSFINVYKKNIPGMLDFASNTLGLNGACTSFTDIFTGCNSPGTSGVSGAWITTDKSLYANQTWKDFVDDLPPIDTNAGTSFDYSNNSSSSNINLPENTEIDYAILVWSGNSTSTSIDVSTKEINFTDSLGVLHTITPQYSIQNDSDFGYYTCATEVTDLIKISRNGTYTVGNIYSEFTTNIATAGWILYVVYTNPYFNYVHININIGNLDVTGATPQQAILSGFETPQTSNANAGILLTSLNGNPSLAGDKVSLSNNDGIDIYLSGPLNPEDNFFNSQLVNIKAEVNTNATFGSLNPISNSIQTQPGTRIGFGTEFVDAGVALSNGQTETTLIGSTTGNNYSITSATLIVKNTFPLFDINCNCSHETILVGEEFTINYNLENIGTVVTKSIDFSYIDTGLEFVSGYYEKDSVVFDIIENPDKLNLPNIDSGEAISINLTYKAVTIPNELFYNNLSLIHYTFILGDSETLENTISSNHTINIAYMSKYTIFNLNPLSISSPIVDASSNNLEYEVINPPSNGYVSIENGVITYTPDILQQSITRFIVGVSNVDNGVSIQLVYDINQVVIPSINKVITHNNTVDLFSSIKVNILFENTSQFILNDVYIWPSLSPGLSLNKAILLDENNNEINIIRSANNFSLENLEPYSAYNIEFTYEAFKIPTDLIYSIGSSGSFVFGGVYFEKLDGSKLVDPYIIYPVASIDVLLYKNNTYDKQIPIIEPAYPNLSYSIKKQGILGSATIDNSGVLSYDPIYNAIGYDEIIINIQNSQLNTSLDVSYKFNIIATSSNKYLSCEFLEFLNDDIYLLEVNKYTSICFNCDIWLDGYIDNTNNISIPSIKKHFIELLNTLIFELDKILTDLNYDTINFDNGFKAQINRFLVVTLDIKNKISSLNCIPDCNDSVYGYFISVLASTINTIIKSYSTLDSLISIDTNNCNPCLPHFNYLMPIFVNSITELHDISNSYNFLLSYFITSSYPKDKSYNATYIPKNKF